MMEPEPDAQEAALKSARAVVKAVYQKYIDAIDTKLGQNETWSSWWHNRNQAKTSSGKEGKEHAEKFLEGIQDATITTVNTLLIKLLKDGHWGGQSRRLVFLCIDLIVCGCNEGNVPEVLYENPAKPFEKVDGLCFAKEHFFSTNKFNSGFRISALQEHLFNSGDNSFSADNYPLNVETVEKLKQAVCKTEADSYKLQMRMRSHRI